MTELKKLDKDAASSSRSDGETFSPSCGKCMTPKA